MAEIEWRDDWPYIKPAPGEQLFVDGLAQNFPQESFAPPGCSDEDTKAVPPVSSSFSKKYLFDGGEIPGDLKSLRVERDPAVYSLTARKGFLRLRGGESPASCHHQSLIARRQTDFSFAAETYMEAAPRNFTEFAGLVWRYDEANQYLLVQEYDEKTGGPVLTVLTMIAGEFTRSNPLVLPETRSGIYLGLTVREKAGRFRYSLDGKGWSALGPALSAEVVSDEYMTLGFTGAFVGLYSADLGRYQAYADFAYLSYTVMG
jgi:xylan 1,4-beta-xylosidase